MKNKIIFKFSENNTFEENIIEFTEHYNNIIELGHGLFFDFSNTPEYEKPVLNYLMENFGWIHERPDFIRKPDK